MKKITRRSFLKASAAAMVASGLAACGGSASSTAASSVASAAGSAAAAGKGTIGILMPTLNAEFFAVTANSMAARLAEEGYTGNIQGFNNDAAQAVSVIENFITDGVQGIVYMTVDTAGDDALKDAMDAGIKVLTCGVENANYDVCQIMDNKATGYQIGEMAANYINENFGGSAKVAYITSTKSQNMMDRVEGYRQAMEELCPGADVVYEAECVDVGQGTTFAENLNTLHPDCKIILSYSDTYTKEIAEVWNALSYPKDAACFGHDAEAAALKNIAEGGYIKGTVSAGDPGVAMAEGMIGCLNGEYKDHELVVIAGTEVTPANIGDFYKA